MSVFIIDNELTNSVKELGEIFGSLNEPSAVSEALSALIDEENNEIKDKSSLIAKVYEISEPETLKKLSDKEFEPTFNLILYILSELEGGIESVFSKDKLLNNLVNTSPSEKLSLRDRKSIKATSILSELTLIFNLLPESSEIRLVVIDKILDFVHDLKLDFKILEKSFNANLTTWLGKIPNVSEADIKKVFWKYILLDNHYSLSSLKAIDVFTKNESSISLDELKHLIHFSFKSDIIDISFIINNNVSKAITAYASDALVATFIKYLNSELLESTPEFPNLKSKSQILSLCKFFSSAEKYHFKFDEITVVPRDELEVLLINSIKFGLIQGKLNQLDSSFHLTKINKFILPTDNETISKNLQNVRNDLINWRNSLVAVGQVVNNFRENIK